MGAATDHTEATGSEQRNFEAEVSQVLNLVVNSLYSNKEIFLRELVSNASDAIDKREFRALTDKTLAGAGPPAIRLLPDSDARTLTIEDDGVGMSKAELIQNLGTIAHSGTQAFLQQAAKNGAVDEVNLIGQFGVGFYSAFLVADKVEVVSRAAGSEEAWRWISDAQESYTIEPAERESVGTTVILHLAEDHESYSQAWQLRQLVRKYSDFVNHPIQMYKDTYDAVDDDDDDDEKPAPAPELENVNEGKALWRRSKDELDEKAYEDFYQHLTGDFQGSLAHSHFKIEGTQMFTGLLYVPQKPPFDLFTRDGRRGVRLFVKRVFIMDDCEELVPQWLRFVRGVIDSDDLPLNVSRELLQDSATTRTIRKQITKKTLDLLESMAADKPESYKDFWSAFGAVIKEGLHYESGKSQERIAKLCRYHSTTADGLTSLPEYVERMSEDQKVIYYLSAADQSLAALAASPHLEALKSRGYEVLFMTDAIDEWAVGSLRQFDGKDLISASHANLDLEASDEDKKATEERAGALEGLTTRIGEILKDHVAEVRVSTRLTDSPACLVVPPGGLSAHLERLLRAADQEVPNAKRILEINPSHVLVQRLEQLHTKNAESAQLTEWVEVLLDLSRLAEGSPIPEPHQLARRVTTLLEDASFRAVLD